MSKPIISVPHAVLRAKSNPFTDFGPETQAQVKDLVDSLRSAKEPEGVGLSFPQIGLSSRGFVTYLDRKVRVYLNPQILDEDDKKSLGGTLDRPTLEGCLSIPWLYGPVWRPKKIKILAYNEYGVEFTKTLSSFPARLFYHELDHLEGILFTDYTLRSHLPLYFLDHVEDKFIEVEDPSLVIKW